MPLVIDGAAIAEMMRSPAGPMARHMVERATLFQSAARKQLAPHRKSGCLEDSMVKRFEYHGAEIAIRVISDTSPCSPTRTAYSLFVHEGTQPHTIVASEGKMLSFYWANGPDGPGQYFFKSVQHPGTTAIKFFTDNLPLFAA